MFFDEMDFRSFMMQEVDGEFKFLFEGCIDDNHWSPSSKLVNNEALVIDVKPLTSIHPLDFVEDVANSDDASARDNENPMVGITLPPLPEAASKVASEASDPLDVDSDPDIFEFPSDKEATASYDAIRARKIEKDIAYAELERKCNEALFDLDRNPLVADMRTKIETFLKSKALNRRERLKLFEIQLFQEMDALKQDRDSIVAKVVPDAATKLIRSDEMGMLVAKLVKASVIYGWCAAFEVAKLKDPFVMEKMAGYRPSLKQEYDQAGDNLANASYPFYLNMSMTPMLLWNNCCRRNQSLCVQILRLMCGPSSPLQRYILLDNVNLGVLVSKGSCGPFSSLGCFILLDNVNLGLMGGPSSSLRRYILIDNVNLVIGFALNIIKCSWEILVKLPSFALGIDDGKTTGVLPKKKSKPINQEPQSKTDFKKLMNKFMDDQRVSKQTNRTDPPPPPQAQTEHVNVVFTRNGKSDDSLKIQKDSPPPIIVNNKIKKDKPIKTSKKGYYVVKINEYPFLNNDVRNGLEDFKRCIRNMRYVHWKLFARDDGKTTSVLPNKESKTVNQEPQSKTDLEKSITKFLDGQRVTNRFFKNNANDMIKKIKQNEKNFQTKIKNMERKINEWSESQNVSSNQTDRTDPPPPQAQTEHVNAVFTGSLKSDYSLKIQKDPPPQKDPQ
nr:hypothetical protein [Tanacetum cinerariifolium]